MELEDVAVPEPAGDPARADDLRLAAWSGGEAEPPTGVRYAPPVQTAEEVLAIPAAEALEQRVMRADAAVEGAEVLRPARIGHAMEDAVMRWDVAGLARMRARVRSEERQRGHREKGEHPA